jgi:hypothetical protein
MLQGHAYALAGDQATARLAFGEAVRLSAESEDAPLINQICRLGSLDDADGQIAQIVMPVCDHAVGLAPDTDAGPYHDSRGIARALAGDLKGAAEDFGAFVAWINNHPDYAGLLPARQDWLKTLAAGQNPIDPAVIQALRLENANDLALVAGNQVKP